jgi:hypothetical protein
MATKQTDVSHPDTNAQQDGGFSNPRVFKSLAEAMAAPTPEEEWLASLDPSEREVLMNMWSKTPTDKKKGS